MEPQHIYATGAGIGAVIFATLVLKRLFRYMTPKTVESDYSECNGRWEESYLAQCERGLLRVPQQPINTYSNLAYIAAGLYIQFALGTDTAFAFAVLMTNLCFASALYHATSTGWAGVLDVTAILAAFPGIAVFAVAAHFEAGNQPVTPLAMFVVGGVLSYTLSKRAHSYMRATIAISLGLSYLLLAGYMLRTSNTTPLPFLIGSLAVFAFGFWCWGLDLKRRFPDSFPVGHGIWHVATAVASALIFWAIDLTQPRPPVL